ncbi:ribosomal RNA processing protein 36 homolog [Amyelois transitella]|uniref:ribosomal RNA processing protein 36 homolog n=1 Tax=Amyelois transitella TaxID=680683 RepID=UPI00067C3E12|nr:ribosomal RNA processing protein 36 homolog [Amyelois transitella]
MSNSDSDQDERTTIREELSSLSFEELQKLKERIGAKLYKEALFGKDDSKKDNSPKVFKRENKNRPREMSSKKPVPMLLDVPKVKKREVRDPRFDPLCGEFDKKQFSENYNFLSEMRIKDIKAIRAELKETSDPEKQKQLRRLLQRLNDQHKATRRKKIEDVEAAMEKKQVEQQFKEGRQPHFKNKSERRVEALVKQYEELKKEGAGRIQRHLKRRQQKLKKRSHKAPTGVS